jgi:hypothetical protein
MSVYEIQKYATNSTEPSEITQYAALFGIMLVAKANHFGFITVMFMFGF